MKLYGFKERDAIGLIETIKQNKNKSLTEVFSIYAKTSKKSRGTIRNLYYTIAKLADQDQTFRQKFLGGERLEVEKKVEFSSLDTETVIREILSKKAEGKSVRKAVDEMANGDAKLALRYQNKYRSLLRKNPDKVREIAREIEMQYPDIKPLIREREEKNKLQVARLKSEINKLFERTFLQLKRENQILRSMLKREASEKSLEGKGKIEEFFKIEEEKTIGK